ncbi:MAG: hypothetical protein JO266_14500 [Acidobacteria bacterium]|nr:hypothetical protein [Acidobacteriota bacterium]
MKQLLLASSTLLGFVALGSAVCAAPIDFTYTGNLVDFTITATGPYQIVAYGAQGGNAAYNGAISPGG